MKSTYTILTPNGYKIIADLADKPLLDQYKWFASGLAPTEKRQNPYLRASGYQIGRKKKYVMMARLLLGLKKGDKRTADHINLNSLDNRRSNLRIATHAQNRANSRPQCKSGVKGVWYDPKRKNYKVVITHNRKSITLGRFATIELASLCYQMKARELWGEFTFNPTVAA